MLQNQNLIINQMQHGHNVSEQILSLLSKACGRLEQLGDVGTECEQLRAALRETESMFGTLRDASTADLSQVLSDVKKYASEVIAVERRDLEAAMKKRADTSEADANNKFKKLEARVLSELVPSSEPGDPSAPKGIGGKMNDTQLLKKVTNRLGDFEAQVASQLQTLSQDVEKKLAFLSSQTRVAADGETVVGESSQDMEAMKYDLLELKDLVSGAKTDTAHVKRIVLACERDMEDFTAAMDAVNVDLDEMRSRVDSTHSIITSRQRVEATVTAEISTMRLDMGDMQEALKAHDAWMEDVSQSLQEAHERCHQLNQDMLDMRDQTQAKLDAKTDVISWNDMNDDMEASIKTVRDMASSLRLEVDSRRRKVDDALNGLRGDIKELDNKLDGNAGEFTTSAEELRRSLTKRLHEQNENANNMSEMLNVHKSEHQTLHSRVDSAANKLEARLNKLEADLRTQDEALHKEINTRVDGVDRNHGTMSKETTKRLNALDLRISGLQGATGEHKRDVTKLRDEVNSLTVKSAAHDVDVAKTSDDVRKLERQRAEDNQRFKQDMDAVYEELDQKVYEKNFQALEENVTKLTRGTVKLCQVVGVFPGARMNDGTEEELDVDVELLNWEDCAQNLVARVEKTWRQASSQKYRSILDLVGKKADHSVLRLLQISQQHIESQLDRVQHERELWKEVVDKRAQQPLQLALTLKDPHTGMPIQGPPGQMMAAGPSPGLMRQHTNPDAARPDLAPMGPTSGVMPGEPGGGMAMKTTPLAKRIVRAPGPPGMSGAKA